MGYSIKDHDRAVARARAKIAEYEEMEAKYQQRLVTMLFVLAGCLAVFAALGLIYS